ncbi:MAG TPA: hypothetical protein PKW79_06035 [Rhabdochlamydiaceae bacterium]|nr:hypothetical protein [Rhabdochlamydiaceae bacterium]
MDTPKHIPTPEDPLTPEWEKWRNEQVETISNILSHVFKVEDAARQTKTPSRLLSAMKAGKNEEEIRHKLNQIRHQLSEYEQMVQLGLKRIDNALQIIQPPKSVEPEKPPEPIRKNWLKRVIDRLRR